MRRMADTTEVPWGGKVSPATISATTIRAQESKKISREKTRVIIAELCEMKLKKAAKKVEEDYLKVDSILCGNVKELCAIHAQVPVGICR